MTFKNSSCLAVVMWAACISMQPLRAAMSAASTLMYHSDAHFIVKHAGSAITQHAYAAAKNAFWVKCASLTDNVVSLGFKKVFGPSQPQPLGTKVFTHVLGAVVGAHVEGPIAAIIATSATSNAARRLLAMCEKRTNLQPNPAAPPDLTALAPDRPSV